MASPFQSFCFKEHFNICFTAFLVLHFFDTHILHFDFEMVMVLFTNNFLSNVSNFYLFFCVVNNAHMHTLLSVASVQFLFFSFGQD